MENFDKDLEGRGIWWLLHVSALYAKRSKHINAVLYNIEIIKNKFGCDKCKKHFKDFIKKHDPYKYAKKGLIFEWTIMSHNNVNKIRNKKLWNIEYAKKHYNAY